MTTAEVVDAPVPRRRAALRRRSRHLGLLRMARADLLEMGIEELRLPRGVAVGPHVHPLRPHVDVDPGVVPEEEPLPQGLGRRLGLGVRQLRGRLALVAGAVGVEIALVDLRRPLEEHHRRPVEAAARRVGEQQGDLRIGLGVARLLRVADAGGDVDAAGLDVVVGGDRPGDRPPARVEGRELRRDEGVEDLTDLLGKRRRHRAAKSTPARRSPARRGAGSASSPRPSPPGARSGAPRAGRRGRSRRPPRERARAARGARGSGTP